ncbi:MAG: tRNA (adenosine(37)-N6)-threonylcarbamoyltransferase complex dimerization subunit type 1 TsaB [Solobacterium sp.]|nr:tRNA (adenosine(37)-N6)-threonylcarbamoyltransferase complex dimerization subunit type 1 TsaB [Solobacterium sp.]
MIYLCMDTSHTWLAVSLIVDDHVAASFQQECWKRQSEEIFPAIQSVMNQAGITPKDVQGIVISKGPGSYTGVRIAMTIAKVYASSLQIPLYTVGSLDLYAGGEDCTVVTDARSKRVYHAQYRNGERVTEVSAIPCEELAGSIPEDEIVIGDGNLIGREKKEPEIAQNFLKLMPKWEKQENIHLVEPEYLKSREAYLVK